MFSLQRCFAHLKVTVFLCAGLVLFSADCICAAFAVQQCRESKVPQSSGYGGSLNPRQPAGTVVISLILLHKLLLKRLITQS